MSPGEIADRIAILELKMTRLPGRRRTIRKQLLEAKKGFEHDFPQMQKLRELNSKEWDAVEVIYKVFSDSKFGTKDWTLTPGDIKKAETAVKAARLCHELNMARVAVKNEINRLLGAATEEKSWKSSTN